MMEIDSNYKFCDDEHDPIYYKGDGICPLCKLQYEMMDLQDDILLSKDEVNS